MSFFIAAFSLLIVGYGVEQITARSKSTAIVWAVLVVLGLLDQTTSSFVPKYADIKADFESDRDFVHQIEATMPDQAMIYQLPLVDFPEHPVEQQMPDYQLFRGYLHSTELRWSYGAMKGREIEEWNKKLESLLAGQKIAVIRREGFSGLYIDTFGFPKGDPIVQNFQALLKRAPIISRNGRLAFFSLRDEGAP
jgi:phosphoglycerol transferase